MARKKQTEVKEIVEKIIPVDYCDEPRASMVPARAAPPA